MGSSVNDFWEAMQQCSLKMSTKIPEICICIYIWVRCCRLHNCHSENTFFNFLSFWRCYLEIYHLGQILWKERL